jgi:hypothetical protein
MIINHVGKSSEMSTTEPLILKFINAPKKINTSKEIVQYCSRTTRVESNSIYEVLDSLEPQHQTLIALVNIYFLKHFSSLDDTPKLVILTKRETIQKQSMSAPITSTIPLPKI